MQATFDDFAGFGNHLREWWSEPADYAAQVEYFTKRAKSGPIQVLIGIGTGTNGLLSLFVLLPSARTPGSQVVVAMFAVLQLFWGWNWCYRPWPSRRVSLAFVISADIGIAAVAVVDASWLLGLFAFNAFAMISVYLMFFDGPKQLAAHVLWLLLATTAFALRVSDATHLDISAFTVKTIAAVAPVAWTPLGIQLAIWSLRNDANESITDPLTGLLNRRGLHLHIADLFRDVVADATDVAVIVVDLDRFKAINDTFGHIAGDEVLALCAGRIVSAAGGSALVARIGGEEFVVVDLVESGLASASADHIRNAVAAPADYSITASVGVTSVALDVFASAGDDPVAVLDSLVQRADIAMFDAKRTGGNTTVHLPPVS